VLISSRADGGSRSPANTAVAHAASCGIVIATDPFPSVAQCGPPKSPGTPGVPSSK
jgi:hypothetical protein